MKYFPWWLRTTSEAPNGEKEEKGGQPYEDIPWLPLRCF
jgi:hypothetical protein